MFTNPNDMKDPKIKTTVLHSYSKNSWNVVCTELGKKYKIARIPYLSVGIEDKDMELKKEAHHHALFISECFNNSKEISDLLENNPT